MPKSLDIQKDFKCLIKWIFTKDFKWQNNLKLYTLKALFSKYWFYFFSLTL